MRGPEARRRLLAGLAVVASATFQACAPGEEETASRRRPYNLVLVSLDTLRADHLGLYGYGRDTSPHLDRLAADSVVFDSAVAHSSHTVPSHNALFQSRVVSRTSDSAPTLAEVLRAAGYRTAAFTGAGKVSHKRGFDRGFDEFAEDLRGFGFSFPKIEEWLEGGTPEPFYLFLHTYDIHLPYDPPPPFDTMFYPEYEGPLVAAETGRLVRRLLRVNEFAESREAVELTAEDRLKLTALYDGGIRYTDQYLGRLVEVLRRQGLWERTVLVVLSDHGEELDDHGGFSHGLTLYQELLRVPLLMRFPQGRFAGTRVAETVRLLDVVPTLLAVIGLEPPPGMEGRSLVPLLTGREMGAAPALAEISGARSLTRAPWKLILRYEEGDALLFHLGDDPHEKVDRAAERPEVVADLRRELEEILAGASPRAIEPVDVAPEDVVDEEERAQLRALGYID